MKKREEDNIENGGEQNDNQEVDKDLKSDKDQSDKMQKLETKIDQNKIKLEELKQQYQAWVKVYTLKVKQQQNIKITKEYLENKLKDIKNILRQKDKEVEEKNQILYKLNKITEMKSSQKNNLILKTKLLEKELSYRQSYRVNQIIDLFQIRNNTDLKIVLDEYTRIGLVDQDMIFHITSWLFQNDNVKLQRYYPKDSNALKKEAQQLKDNFFQEQIEHTKKILNQMSKENTENNEKSEDQTNPIIQEDKSQLQSPAKSPFRKRVKQSQQLLSKKSHSDTELDLNQQSHHQIQTQEGVSPLKPEQEIKLIGRNLQSHFIIPRNQILTTTSVFEGQSVFEIVDEEIAKFHRKITLKRSLKKSIEEPEGPQSQVIWKMFKLHFKQLQQIIYLIQKIGNFLLPFSMQKAPGDKSNCNFVFTHRFNDEQEQREKEEFQKRNKKIVVEGEDDIVIKKCHKEIIRDYKYQLTCLWTNIVYIYFLVGGQLTNFLDVDAHLLQNKCNIALDNNNSNFQNSYINGKESQLKQNQQDKQHGNNYDESNDDEDDDNNSDDIVEKEKQEEQGELQDLFHAETLLFILKSFEQKKKKAKEAYDFQKQAYLNPVEYKKIKIKRFEEEQLKQLYSSQFSYDDSIRQTKKVLRKQKQLLFLKDLAIQYDESDNKNIDSKYQNYFSLLTNKINVIVSIELEIQGKRNKEVYSFCQNSRVIDVISVLKNVYATEISRFDSFYVLTENNKFVNQMKTLKQLLNKQDDKHLFLKFKVQETFA